MGRVIGCNITMAFLLFVFLVSGTAGEHVNAGVVSACTKTPTINLAFYIAYFDAVAVHHARTTPLISALGYKRCNVLSSQSVSWKLDLHRYRSSSREANYDLLHIWRFPGEPPNVFKLWETIQIVVELREEEGQWCEIYQNANKSELLSKFDNDKRLLNRFFRKWSAAWHPSSYLHPFTPAYIGIEASTPYKIYLKYKNLDYLLMVMFCAGIALFFAAKRLSRSAVAFYAGGSTFGVFCALLVFVFVLYRFVPKRSLAVSALVGGWSLVFYLVYMIWTHFYLVLTQYYRYVAMYLVSAALISFCVCYRRGPPKDFRTQNLMQWALQIIALSLVYFGCQIQTLSLAIIISLLAIANMPACVGRLLHRLKLRLFVSKRRLLTEEEYINEGMVETKRALDELRTYCRSPDCDTWKTVSRLKSPSQFSDFVCGRRSHVTDDEVLRYGQTSGGEYDDDDEDDSVSGDSETNNLSVVRKMATKDERIRNSFAGFSSSRLTPGVSSRTNQMHTTFSGRVEDYSDDEDD